jgi:hypothetical protein
MARNQRKTLLIGSLVFAGLVVLVLVIAMNRTRGQPNPNLAALEGTLEQTARLTLNDPALLDAVVELKVAKDSLVEEIDRIKKLAEQFGGSAIQGDMNPEEAEVLAQVPRILVEEFSISVRDTTRQPETLSAEVIGEFAWVGVRLRVEG